MRRHTQKLGGISSGVGIFLRCKKKCTNRGDLCILRGADDGIRTRDLRLTKDVLYSKKRKCSKKIKTAENAL